SSKAVPTRKQRRTAEKAARAVQKKKEYNNTRAAKLGLSQAKVSPYVRIDRQFKTFKPITPSLRWVRYNINDHLYGGRPEKSLTVAKRSTGGRNHHGRVTVRGRGGGHRRRLRMVDFWRWEAGPQEVIRIEYDPGRSAHIALIKHKETDRLSYILAPDGLRAGDTVESYRTMKEVVGSSGEGGAASALDLGIFRTKAIRPGNVLPLHLIPIGTTIHAISLNPVGPAKVVRSAGASGQLIAFVNRSKATTTHAQVKLQSGEVRMVTVDCVAAIGRVSNIDHEHVRLGKAGRSRWLGRRPKVRGVAMNAVDHPHGGGRGKSKSNMHPRSIYGHLEGKRTRKPGTKNGNQFVVRERPRQNGKRAG
ncbi:ribosomal protein L2, partial [Microstroma glucosiphilum]